MLILELLDLFAKIFTQDPNDRIDMDGLRNHPWVNKGQSEPPKRVIPKVVSIQDEKLANIIQSINFDGELMTYTLESRHKMNFGEISSMVRKNSTTSSDIAGRRRRETSKGAIAGRRKHSPLAPSALATAEGEDGSQLITPVAQSSSSETATSTGQSPLDLIAQPKPIPNNMPRSFSLSNMISENSGLPQQQSSRNRTVSLSRSTAVSQRLSISVGNEQDAASDSEIEFDEIQEWHTIHMPPTEIRTKKFSFNNGLSSATLEPAIMFQHLHQAIMSLEEYQEGKLTINRERTYYLLFCTYETEEVNLKFEVELCKLWLVNSHAVQFKKVSGDSILFKSMHDQIAAELKWD